MIRKRFQQEGAVTMHSCRETGGRRKKGKKKEEGKKDGGRNTGTQGEKTVSMSETVCGTRRYCSHHFNNFSSIFVL
jgi:hypothetical protein